MNNRLKRLAERSFWDKQAQQDMEDFIDLEKFAELIIRECADIGNHAATHGEARLVRPSILEHFGVSDE